MILQRGDYKIELKMIHAIQWFYISDEKVLKE